MKVSEFKNCIQGLGELHFQTPDLLSVPAHFHVTEMGLQVKHYVDCGGQMRSEKKATMQLWVAEDTEHRLTPTKLIGIVDSSEMLFGLESLELEVEYQGATIERYGLDFKEGVFVLIPLKTDCLAPDRCGIPLPVSEKKKVNLKELGTTAKNADASSCCTPGGGCC